MATVHPSFWLLGMFCLYSSAFGTNNSSKPFLRTFSGHTLKEAGADYLDLSLLDDDDTGSGFQSQAKPVRSHHGSHPPYKQYFVSEEAKRFLKGYLSTAFVPTVYTFVFIISVPLNLVAAVIFVHPIRPRKPAVIYMLNLASADLLFGLLLPFKMVYHYHGNNWTYGPFMCRVVTAAFYCNMYCSVLLMACISIDRFMAVVYPMNSLTWRSPQTAWGVCVAMWLLALAGAAPLLAAGQTAHLPHLHITTCHDVQDAGELIAFYGYFFPIYSSVFFFIPLIFTVACYVRIIQALAASNIKNRTKKTRAVVMAVIVLVVFLACFTPANIILMVHYVEVAHKSSDTSYLAYLLATCVGSLSCCLDPLLYYFGSSQCRKRVVALFGRGRPRQMTSSLRTESTATSKRRDSSRSCKMEVVQNGPCGQYSMLDT